MENTLTIILLLFWFIYFFSNYSKALEGMKQFILDLLTIILSPIKLLLTGIWKILNLLKKKEN